MSEEQEPILRRGSDCGSPYPVSRLAPAFGTGDLVLEVARAESLLSARTGAKLRVIADQIQALQAEARKVLDEAREEQSLMRAHCSFRRIPGHCYHLYRKPDGTSYFSMLSPLDWHGAPPHPFLGSYRLEADYSWTPDGKAAAPDNTGDLVAQLLRIGGIASGER